DNLKAFRRMESPASPDYVVDTIPLTLLVKQKSTLNSFDTLTHGEIETQKNEDGSRICRFEAENSIELILRIIQCGDAVEVLEPLKFRTKLKDYLENILKMYK
ncbi:MAG: WYL domain-containing protein, partial [Spirochaetales bacterium]|nr:WYL domain-containing protein [Spirochaetales bacterium]